jgi:Dna[CI] antecedent, DciA
MEPLGDEIRAELRRVGADGGPGAAAAAWPGAVGEEIARNAWPARTQADGTLIIHVRDAVWGFELTQRAAEIADRLPDRPRLRFIPGPLPEAVSATPSPHRLEATADQARTAEQLAGPIQDPTLREAVSRAVRAGLARARDDRSV